MCECVETQKPSEKTRQHTKREKKENGEKENKNQKRECDYERRKEKEEG